MCGKWVDPGNDHRIIREGKAVGLHKPDGLILQTKPEFPSTAFVDPFVTVINPKRQMITRDVLKIMNLEVRGGGSGM